VVDSRPVSRDSGQRPSKGWTKIQVAAGVFCRVSVASSLLFDPRVPIASNNTLTIQMRFERITYTGHMRIRRAQQKGFTLVEIMVVVAIIGLLAAIAVPNFVKARTTSQTNACIENLRKIDGAKHAWAVENKKVSDDTPGDADLFGDTLYIRTKPVCPAGGNYRLEAVREKPGCDKPGHEI
jgi:prepilin-type N-terminal cleavage/methylation domain-containing protein